MRVDSWIVLYGCAWLFSLLVRREDIAILVKSKNQRTDREQKRIERGLLRSVFLEAFLFVPASATILLVTKPLLLELLSENWRLKLTSLPEASLYGVLGLISYAVPFASVRHIITRIALKALREFQEILLEQTSEEEEGEKKISH